jgi:hypothetical protein
VVLGVQDVSIVAQLLPQRPVHKQFLFDPQRTGEQKLPETLWGHAEIGLQNALELEQRFVVERYEGEISRPDAGPPKAELDRVRRKRGISLLAREAPRRMQAALS